METRPRDSVVFRRHYTTVPELSFFKANELTQWKLQSTIIYIVFFVLVTAHCCRLFCLFCSSFLLRIWRIIWLRNQGCVCWSLTFVKKIKNLRYEYGNFRYLKIASKFGSFFDSSQIYLSIRFLIKLVILSIIFLNMDVNPTLRMWLTSSSH